MNLGTFVFEGQWMQNHYKCISEWCILPRGIAGPPDQSSRIRRNWPNPQPSQISLRSNKKCARYPLSKICASAKWTNVHPNTKWPATHKCPYHAKFHLVGQTMYKKSITKLFFYSLQYFGATEGPPVQKVTNVGPD